MARVVHGDYCEPEKTEANDWIASSHKAAPRKDVRGKVHSAWRALCMGTGLLRYARKDENTRLQSEASVSCAN